MTFKKVSFQKRYKDLERKWKSTNSLDTNDIPKAVLALLKAYECIVFGGITGENGKESGQNE